MRSQWGPSSTPRATNQRPGSFLNILATFAEFEVDLLRLRTREGMAIARADGKLKGKQPKLTPRQRVYVLRLVQAGSTRSLSSASCSRSAARRSTARSPERAAS
jgi:DNA invertase Pin-like site-specific DNA recombinase